ncbi:MAG: hypothetical protein K2J49_05025, partial [Muribaculaceae bacterium]|nr:hypothetical protein [Muribaculaceae bacterium]
TLSLHHEINCFQNTIHPGHILLYNLYAPDYYAGASCPLVQGMALILFNGMYLSIFDLFHHKAD